MWRLRTDPVLVGVAQNALCWRRESAPASALQWIPASRGWPETLSQLGAQLDKQLGPRSPKALKMALGADVSRHWVQTPPPGLRSLAELRELVQSRAEQLFGDHEAWRVEGQWRAAQPFLCAAIPLPLHDAIQGLAARWASPLARQLNRWWRRSQETSGTQGLHLSTSFCSAWSHTRVQATGDAWVLHQEGPHLSVCLVQGGALQGMRSVVLRPATDVGARQADVQEELQRTQALLARARGFDAQTQPEVIHLGSPEPGLHPAAAALNSLIGETS